MKDLVCIQSNIYIGVNIDKFVAVMKMNRIVRIFAQKRCLQTGTEGLITAQIYGQECGLLIAVIKIKHRMAP